MDNSRGSDDVSNVFYFYLYLLDARAGCWAATIAIVDVARVFFVHGNLSRRTLSKKWHPLSVPLNSAALPVLVSTILSRFGSFI